MNNRVTERELTLRTSLSSMLQFMTAHENEEGFTHYYEHVQFNNNVKLVHRFYEDGSIIAYEKYTQHCITYGFNDGVFKLSRETSFQPTLAKAPYRSWICKRFCQNQYEYTIKVKLIQSDHTDNSIRSPICAFNEYIGPDKIYNSTDVYSSAAIEIDEKIQKEVPTMKLFSPMFEVDAPAQYQAAKASITRCLRDTLEKSLDPLMRLHPLVISASDWRKVISRENIDILFSEKSDGIDCIGFICDKSKGVILVSKNGVFCIFNGIVMRPIDVAHTELYRNSIIMRHLKICTHIIHGELIHTEETHGFVLFAMMKINNPGLIATEALMRRVPDFVVRSFMPITVQAKTYYQSYSQSLANRTGIPEDGTIITVLEEVPYPKLQIFKHKPHELNTIDLLIKNGVAYYTADSNAQMFDDQFHPIRINFINECKMNHTPGIIDERPDSEKRHQLANGIFECKIINGDDIDPNPRLSVISNRPDKLYPNGIRAYAAIIGAKYLIDWSKIIDQIDEYKQVVFGMVRSKSQERFILSSVVFKVVDDFINKGSCNRIIDLGGGKLGYFKIIIKYIGSIELYVNFDLAAFDLADSLMRVSKCSSLMKVYYVFNGSFASNTSWHLFNENCDAKFNAVLSVFAFHYAFESLNSADVAISNLSDLIEIGGNVLIISYDYDAILDALKTVDILDLGIVRFESADNDDNIGVRAEFNSYELRTEPCMKKNVLMGLMEKRGFMKTLDILLCNIYEADPSVQAAAKYICVYKFVKFN